MPERARRFPPPCSIDEHAESFIVHDATRQALGYFYFDDDPQRRSATKRLTKDEAQADRHQHSQAAGPAAQGWVDRRLS